MDYESIILELFNRIKKLEKDVEELKKVNVGNTGDDSSVDVRTSDEEKLYVNLTYSSTGKRDMTRYMFNGNTYLKNRLVLAVVKDYVDKNPDITRQLLLTCFNKSLQGSIGVVEKVEYAKKRTDYTVRFFTRPNEVLHLADGDMYVCTQWGISNINNFISRAKQLGYVIEPIMQV